MKKPNRKHYRTKDDFNNEQYEADLESYIEHLETKFKKFRLSNVSGSLRMAEKLLSSIISADPNVVDKYGDSDVVIRDLFNQARRLVRKLKQ